MSGLHLELQRPLRGLASVAVFTMGLLWFGTSDQIATGVAIGCFVVAAALRFGFLFASFLPSGVASRLKARLGFERGYVVYAAGLDLLLFAQRVSFLALVGATSHAPVGAFGAALVALGLLIVPLGIGVSIWAVRVLGLDAYHYRDLFAGSRTASLARSGPYALWRNPMYSVGPLAAYGLALVALSPVALLAAGLNQVLLFAFNELVEQPRLRSADNIFVETQLRYALAQALLGFDPRTELAHRVHSDEPTAIKAFHRPAAM